MPERLKLSTRAWLKAVRAEYWLARNLLPDVYSNDALICFNSYAFMDDPEFQRAYERGARALGDMDWYQWHWRVHVGLWAAGNASRIEGDFVECGVSYGFLSSAVMEHLDWDQLGKTFYLLDTFAGLDPRFVSAEEREAGALEKSEELVRNGMYGSSVDSVRANFAQWRNQRIVVGAVPETLAQVDSDTVAFLHLDMNCAPPEVAALRHFWPRLAPGAFVLLDDYANRGRDEQRIAMDEVAAELGVSICSLPTGQGLLIKPPRPTDRRDEPGNRPAKVAPGIGNGQAPVVRAANKWPLKFRIAWAALRTAYWIPRKVLPDVYSDDALICFNSHAFMDDPAFRRAYRRGVLALGGKDIHHWHWRVHVGLWAAATASTIEGDFVECGVSHGFLSSAVMEYLDWDQRGKMFYLLDTFAGMDPRFVTAGEREAGALIKNQAALDFGIYGSSVDSVRANFAQWRNQRIVVGAVPETLEQVEAKSIAFLHIDMNCAPPEVATLRYFWSRLSPGALVLLDDYANRGRDDQRIAMDEVAHELGVQICALPTGQGLLVKPPEQLRSSSLSAEHAESSRPG